MRTGPHEPGPTRPLSAETVVPVAVSALTTRGGHTVPVTPPASDQTARAARPRFATVLFDLDGTLADTIPLIVASYQHAFRTVLAEEVEETRARAWIGRPLLPALLEESPEHGHDLDRVYREWNLANTARLIRRYPGVVELLGDLASAGVTCAVATSKRRETARLALRLRRHRPSRRRRRRPGGHPGPQARSRPAAPRGGGPRRRPGRLRLRRRRHGRRPGRPGRRDGRRGRHVGSGERAALVATRPDALVDSVPELAAYLLGSTRRLESPPCTGSATRRTSTPSSRCWRMPSWPMPRSACGSRPPSTSR